MTTRASRPPAPQAEPAARARPARSARDTGERLLRAAHKEFVRHGFSGARVERIVAAAEVNPRMLYHHFGGKSQLYIAVLEEALAGLRSREMTVDTAQEDPLQGLMELFDFLVDHFRRNPDLIRLLSGENIERARYMEKSARIGAMSSPVLTQIGELLTRGAANGTIRPGLDPLTLYVMMVAQAQFHISNRYTFSAIFSVDIGQEAWIDAHDSAAREMVRAYLRNPG